MVEKKKESGEESSDNQKEAERLENEAQKVLPARKKKAKKHHKKVVVKSNHLSSTEAQAMHQKMLEATRDGSTLPMPSAVANAMPMPMTNFYGGPQVQQFPQQAPMNNFQPVTPESNVNAQSSQRDESGDDNEYGFEGSENAETTIMHKLKKKAHKKHHHHHHNHHKSQDRPINVYDLGKGM